jgi:molecular chaperone DnaK (HSP70)
VSAAAGSPAVRWTLCVDLGTTSTAAAVAIGDERRLVELDGRASMPSAVLVPPEGDELVVGVAAEAQATMYPDRVERTPKRRVGDPLLLLGGRAIEPADALAALLRHAAAEATSHLGGIPPQGLVLTHPARWGSSRLEVLRGAAQRCGLPEPELVPEPVAAAAHLAFDLVDVGQLLAVYDLGGGTLDVAIVRRTEGGFEVAGPPGGDERLGGEALDDRIVEALRARLDPGIGGQLATSSERTWQQARLQLRRDARAAKEALSSSSRYEWYAGAPLDQVFALTQEELEAVAAQPIRASVDSLLETLRRSGLQPDDLQAAVMVGGSTRTPLVGRMLSTALGGPPTTWGDPKAAVCLGGLLVADTAPRATPSAPQRPQSAPSSRTPDEAPPHSPESAASDAVASEPVESEPVASGPVESEPAAADPEIEREGTHGWSRERIGATIGIGLISLGLVSALLATLVR